MSSPKQLSNQEILEKVIQRAIDGYEDKYEIDRAGNVWSIKSNKYIKHYIDRKGYPRVGLWSKIDGQWRQKNVLVHRLVAQTFIPNPENKPIVHHINGDRMDCYINNLTWATASENVQDGFDRGRKTWNKDMKSVSSMDLQDLAKELPRLQELAKALWGDKWVTEFPAYHDKSKWRNEDGSAHFKGHKYLFHLQQMVIADDPIKYLGDNI